jgi:ferredoxin-type protein NapF
MDPQRRLFLRGRLPAKAPRATPRPPWAVAAPAFIARCTRCEACIKACPQGILFKGEGGYPQVRFDEAGCTTCGHCVDACTTQALVRHPDQQPWEWRAAIGDGCLAFSKVECRVCGEICDNAAIRFVPTLAGVSCPTLNVENCTGCGVCVAPCPTQAITMEVPKT